LRCLRFSLTQRMHRTQRKRLCDVCVAVFALRALRAFEWKPGLRELA